MISVLINMCVTEPTPLIKMFPLTPFQNNFLEKIGCCH